MGTQPETADTDKGNLFETVENSHIKMVNFELTIPLGAGQSVIAQLGNALA
jgi:hypothetical protein